MDILGAISRVLFKGTTLDSPGTSEENQEKPQQGYQVLHSNIAHQEHDGYINYNFYGLHPVMYQFDKGQSTKQSVSVLFYCFSKRCYID
jgi:hypothetical protein